MVENKYKKNKFISRSDKIGLPPGTLQKPVDSPNTATQFTIYEYNVETFVERDFFSLVDVQKALENQNTVKWIDIDGIHNPKEIEEIGKQFKIHPLTLEDIMSTDQRPKFEEYENYTTTTFKMLSYENGVVSEQLTILLFDNLVITFQEANAKDAFNNIRERLRFSKGRVRKMNADYLSYVLIDSVVDTYFTILENLGLKIDHMEDEIIKGSTHITTNDLHHIKREVIYLRKNVWPLRELIYNIQRSDSNFYEKGTHIYLRDVYDHIIRLIETIDSYHDLINGLMDLYLNNISNKTNQVVKLLTIISSIFIPVTFIAGVYGMNFKYMPELDSKYGYFSVLILMFTTVVGMLYYFKRRKWL